MSIPAKNNFPDPILDEIHATRRRLLKEHGGISGLAEFLRREEATTKWPIAKTSAESKPAQTPSPKIPTDP